MNIHRRQHSPTRILSPPRAENDKAVGYEYCSPYYKDGSVENILNNAVIKSAQDEEAGSAPSGTLGIKVHVSHTCNTVSIEWHHSQFKFRWRCCGSVCIFQVNIHLCLSAPGAVRHLRLTNPNSNPLLAPTHHTDRNLLNFLGQRRPDLRHCVSGAGCAYSKERRRGCLALARSEPPPLTETLRAACAPHPPSYTRAHSRVHMHMYSPLPPCSDKGRMFVVQGCRAPLEEACAPPTITVSEQAATDPVCAGNRCEAPRAALRTAVRLLDCPGRLPAPRRLLAALGCQRGSPMGCPAACRLPPAARAPTAQLNCGPPHTHPTHHLHQHTPRAAAPRPSLPPSAARPPTASTPPRAPTARASARRRVP